MIQSFNSSKHPQPTHAAVRKNIEAEMRNRTGVCYFVKEVTRVSLQLRPRQHGFPNKLRVLQFLNRRLASIACFERATLGKISFEPGRIDFQTLDVTARA